MSSSLYNQGLVYHKVSEDFEWGLTTVSPFAFKKQITALRQRDLHFKCVHELSSQHTATRERAVAITFDDGYRSVYTHAFPILSEQKIPGTVFIITDYVGKTNDWDWQIGGRRFEHLGWSEVRELHAAGWEIGSHTASHRILTTINRNAIQEELKISKDTLEQSLGAAVHTICPPFNRFNVEILELARATGYLKCAVSFPLEDSPVEFEDFIIPRLGVYHHEWLAVVRGKLEVNLWSPLVVLQQQIINLAARGTEIRKRLST